MDLKKTMKWHKPAETLDLTNGRVLFLHEKIDGDGLYCYNWEHRQRCRNRKEQNLKWKKEKISEDI